MFARAMDKFLSFFNYYYLDIPNNLLPPPRKLRLLKYVNLENHLYPYTRQFTNVIACKEVSIHFPVNMLYIHYLG